MKPFLTYEQQLEKLKSKGLTIPDENKAKALLKNIGYFSLISGYKELFKKSDDDYIAGTTFDDIYALYKFDDELRYLVLRYILMFENKIKSVLSYSFVESYGELQIDYLDVTNYNYTSANIGDINDLVGILSKIITPPFSHSYISHQYYVHNNVPLWVTVKALTLGNLSKMYSLYTNAVQTKICKEFNSVFPTDLEAMFSILVRFRNVCAHNERLYDYRVTKKTIKNTWVHRKLNIPQNPKNGVYRCGKNDLFSVYISLKLLLPDDVFPQLILDTNILLKHLFSQTNRVQEKQILKKMGFPENWYEIMML